MKKHPFLRTVPRGVPKVPYKANGHTFTMVQIKGGPFQMGDEYGDLWEACRPKHEVNVPDFELGEILVTQSLWRAVMGTDPSHLAFREANRPVEGVRWDDIVKGTKEQAAFLDQLNAIEEIKQRNTTQRKRFRLPTEAQWEYAARGGRFGVFHKNKYGGSNHLREVAWYRNNSHGSTVTVGRKQPNVLGLYDMSGNVYEWCSDAWSDNYKRTPRDGSAYEEKEQTRRVVRGGSWYYNVPDFCRVALRDGYDALIRFDVIGFRLSRY